MVDWSKCPTARKMGSYTLKHTPHKPTYYPIFAQCAQVIKVGHPWLLLVIPGPWNGGEGAKEKSESKKIGTLMRNLELARCHFNERQATRWTTPMRPNIHFLWKELNTLGQLCCTFSANINEQIDYNQMYWKYLIRNSMAGVFDFRILMENRIMFCPVWIRRK